jgi:hypothetical protein
VEGLIETPLERKGIIMTESNEENFGREKSAEKTGQKNPAQKSAAVLLVEFPHWETHLPNRLGASRDELRELRQNHLKEHVHWVLVRNRVQLNDEGLTLLGELLGLHPVRTHGAAALEENAPGGATAEALAPNKRVIAGLLGMGGQQATFTMKIWKANLPNKRAVLAYFPGTDPDANTEHRHTVDVPNNTNFIREQEIPVRDNGNGRFVLDGPCPRRRGGMVKRFV